MSYRSIIPVMISVLIGSSYYAQPASGQIAPHQDLEQTQIPESDENSYGYHYKNPETLESKTASTKTTHNWINVADYNKVRFGSDRVYLLNRNKSSFIKYSNPIKEVPAEPAQVISTPPQEITTQTSKNRTLLEQILINPLLDTIKSDSARREKERVENKKKDDEYVRSGKSLFYNGDGRPRSGNGPSYQFGDNPYTR